MAEAEQSDERLVAQAQRGDSAAFGLLVDRHQDALYNGICRLVSRREDAEDLAQDTFVKAFRNIGGFQGRSSFYTWLYSIALNVVISHRRKVGVRRRVPHLSLSEGGDHEGSRDVPDRHDPPDATSERRELVGRLREAIAELDDDYRTIVVLRDIEGFDYEAIAGLLDCPQGTVKSRLHRARLELRAKLKDLVG